MPRPDRDDSRVSDESPGDPNVSAEVILRPAGGRRVSGQDRITSENVQAFLPDPSAVSGVSEFFRRVGFEVSEAVGLSFSIAGPVSLFEGVFGEHLSLTGEGRITEIRTDGGRLEMPLDRVPPELADLIEIVTFTPPPDFGPTDYR
jgi:hypothetical protein